jgi:hypothetical protein
MPKHQVSKSDGAEVTAFLRGRGLRHLRARHRGDLVIIESGPSKDPWPHARLRRVGVHIWQLEMATHIGRWEPTPLRGLRDQLLTMLVDKFGWTLQPIE